MKRRLLVIAVFLVAGAVVNVAVAWGFALIPRSILHVYAHYTAEESIWHLAPPAWGEAERVLSDRFDPFGMTWILLSAAAPMSSTELVGFSFRQISTGWPSRSLTMYTLSAGHLDERDDGLFIWWSHDLHGGWIVASDPDLTFDSLGPEDTKSPAIISPFRSRWLPILPVWPGFAVNTLFYAAILWLPFVLRRWVRVRRGLCPKCAYPMGDSAVCSECGKTLPQRARTAA